MNTWRTLLNPGGLLLVCSVLSGLTAVRRLPSGSFEERAIAGPSLGACPLTVPVSPPAPLMVRDRADPDFRQARGAKAAVRAPVVRLRTDDFVEVAGSERFLEIAKVGSLSALSFLSQCVNVLTLSAALR